MKAGACGDVHFFIHGSILSLPNTFKIRHIRPFPFSFPLPNSLHLSPKFGFNRFCNEVDLAAPPPFYFDLCHWVQVLLYELVNALWIGWLWKVWMFLYQMKDNGEAGNLIILRGRGGGGGRGGGFGRRGGIRGGSSSFGRTGGRSKTISRWLFVEWEFVTFLVIFGIDVWHQSFYIVTQNGHL